MERQTGVRPKDLEGPEFPFLMSHVWSAFLHLSSRRTGGFSGSNPILYEQILAFKEVTGTPLSYKDTDTIIRLDNIWMKVANG